MVFIEINMMLWFFISVLAIIIIRIFRPMIYIKDNLRYNDLSRQFAPHSFFLSPIYGEGFVFFMGIISAISFLFFSIGFTSQIISILPPIF